MAVKNTADLRSLRHQLARAAVTSIPLQAEGSIADDIMKQPAAGIVRASHILPIFTPNSLQTALKGNFILYQKFEMTIFAAQ